MSKASQKAGPNSTQVTVAGDMNLGLTVDEGIQIARLVAQQVIQEYAASALEVAHQRIDEFDQKLVDLLDQTEALSMLGDPAFQILMKKAQRSAAASGRPEDLDRLAQLLNERATQVDRIRQAATDQAVQVVDLVADEALAALTMSRFMQLQWALDGELHSGLDRFERFASALMEMSLPTGEEWVEHLDSLGLVRISRSEHFNSASEVLSRTLPGYVCRGVDGSDVEAMNGARSAIKHLPLIEHELKPGFFRFPFSSEDQVRQIQEQHADLLPSVQELLDAAATHTGFPEADAALTPRLMNEFEKREASGSLIAWWVSQTLAYRFTPAGTVLASANSKRLLRQAGLS